MHTGTFGNEDDLPRVPLPGLEDSCERFIDWCAPLLTAAELASTKRAVAEFLRPDSPAHTLQSALEQYAARDDVHSWLDEFWADRYLARRDRIALNANFFFLLEQSGRDQVDRAAELVAAALDYKGTLDAETAPPAEQRGSLLSMEQHKFLFSSTRIPGSQRDTARTPYSPPWPGPSQERHIAVLFRSNLFHVEVIEEGGRPYPRAAIAGALRRVMRDGAAEGVGVGALTTKPRAEWAASRQALLECHPANQRALEEVETALLCLCLEDTDPGSTRAVCRQLLAGDPGNRWFDKAVSFVLFPDGSAGVNVEHCRLDGTTILAFVDAVADRTVPPYARSRREPDCRMIEFVLDDGLRADVRAAADAFAEYAADTATELVSLEDFGAQRAKRLDMSPDAFVQLAYQLAHRRARARTGTTYESIATRQFHHGRTEAMRVVTPETLRFVAAMDDPDADPVTRRTALRAAAEADVRRAKKCQAGLAPEQHLWELQLLQRRVGEELGATGALTLHDSPGWRIMRDDYLSTSSAASVNIRYFGFGATSDHCIGVAYVLLPDRLNVHLSTRRAGADEMHRFAVEFRHAVGALAGLLTPE